MNDEARTPWTQEQVDNLNRRQRRNDLHPYTCGNDSSHPILVATMDGWVCDYDFSFVCGYRQYWAHTIDVTTPGDTE